MDSVTTTQKLLDGHPVGSLVLRLGIPAMFGQFFKGEPTLSLDNPAWMTLTLFIFRDSWALQPGGTIFSESLKTLPNILSQITSSGIARSGSAMAATVLLMIPPVLIYFVTQSNVMETMSSAGIKE